MYQLHFPTESRNIWCTDDFIQAGINVDESYPYHSKYSKGWSSLFIVTHISNCDACSTPDNAKVWAHFSKDLNGVLLLLHCPITRWKQEGIRLYCLKLNSDLKLALTLAMQELSTCFLLGAMETQNFLSHGPVMATIAPFCSYCTLLQRLFLTRRPAGLDEIRNIPLWDRRGAMKAITGLAKLGITGGFLFLFPLPLEDKYLTLAL